MWSLFRVEWNKSIAHIQVKIKIIGRLFNQHGMTYQKGNFDLTDATNNNTGIYALEKLYSRVKLAVNAVAMSRLCFKDCRNDIVKAFCRGHDSYEAVQEFGASDNGQNATHEHQRRQRCAWSG
jgi:hypothetical protein